MSLQLRIPTKRKAPEAELASASGTSDAAPVELEPADSGADADQGTAAFFAQLQSSHWASHNLNHSFKNHGYIASSKRLTGKRQFKNLKQMVSSAEPSSQPSCTSRRDALRNITLRAHSFPPSPIGLILHQYLCCILADSTISAPPSLLPAKKYCDVTALAAKYTDPKSKLRYHSTDQFKLIQLIPEETIAAYLSLRGSNVQLR
jgi:hypothetical protein